MIAIRQRMDRFGDEASAKASPTRRRLGRTDLLVSNVGLGAGPLGDRSIDDRQASRVIHAALDVGINVIDTAPSYGCSEERVGRALAGRRDSVVVVTKGGYGVAGVADWTGEVITRGIDRALQKIGTDYLDVFLLHSCDLATLENGELLEALLRAREAGKTRAIGYSGDGPPLAFAASSDAFDVLECSVNLVDQEALSLLAQYRAEGAVGDQTGDRNGGVLAKRAMANAAWRAARTATDATESKDGKDVTRADVALYRQRLDTLFGDLASGFLQRSDWDEIAIRFSAHAPGVACALVGTQRPEHIVRAVELAARGPLPGSHLRMIAQRHDAHARDWPGVV